MFRMGQMFCWEFENDLFYLVNNQEKTYMKIAEKDSKYYELCNHLYCHNWSMVKDKIIDIYKLVDSLKELNGEIK